jgi:hypothetical protein
MMILWGMKHAGVYRVEYVARCQARLQNCESDYEPRHICLSFRPHATTRLPMDGFREMWYLSVFWKSAQKIEFD